jgi:hypothetical protein
MTSGFDISLYCCSKKVPYHEASPLKVAVLLLKAD